MKWLDRDHVTNEVSGSLCSSADWPVWSAASIALHLHFPRTPVVYTWLYTLSPDNYLWPWCCGVHLTGCSDSVMKSRCSAVVSTSYDKWMTILQLKLGNRVTSISVIFSFESLTFWDRNDWRWLEKQARGCNPTIAAVLRVPVHWS